MKRRMFWVRMSVLSMAVLLFCLWGMSWAWEEKVSYKWLIEPKYKWAFAYSEGLWPVEKDGLWGYVDSADRVVVDFQYFGAAPFRNGMAYVEVSEDVWGLIDPTGRPVIALQEGIHLLPPFLVRDPLLGSKKDIRVPFGNAQDRYGFLDLSGKVRIPAIYDSVGQFSEGLAAVVSGDCWGVIDTDGRWVISLHSRYRGLKYFKGGYIPFMSKERLWGFIDSGDRVVLEPKYTRLQDSWDGSGPWLVECDGKIGYLAPKLNVLADCKYDPADPLFATQSYPYAGGVAFACEDGTYKALDTEGNELFQFPAFLATPVSELCREGYYVLYAGREEYRPFESKFFLLDKQGVMILPPEFQEIRPSADGIIAVCKEKRWGLIDLNRR